MHSLFHNTTAHSFIANPLQYCIPSTWKIITVIMRKFEEYTYVGGYCIFLCSTLKSINYYKNPLAVRSLSQIGKILRYNIHIYSIIGSKNSIIRT